MRYILGLFLCFVTACSGVKPETSDQFVPQDVKYKEYKSQATLYWVDENLHLNKDSRVMITPVELVISPDFEKKTGITPQEAGEIVQFFDKKLQEVFGKYNLLTDKPGKNVLRMSLAITDLVPSNRFLNALSAVNPVSVAISAGRYAVTGRPSNVGEVELAMVLRDSETNQIVAAVKSRQIGDKYDISGVINTLGNAKSEISDWVEELVKPWLEARQKQ